LSLRQLQVTVPPGRAHEVVSAAESCGVLSVTNVGASPAGHDLVIVNLEMGQTEELVELLNARFEREDSKAFTVAILPVEATVAASKPAAKVEGEGRAAREEVHEELVSTAQMDNSFFLLTVLSTVVVTFGMIMDDAAVVVGAMVIAPLLGPIVAFTFGIVTADTSMMHLGIRSEVVGLVLVVFAAALFGALFPGIPLTMSEQIAIRARPSLFNLVLALAAGTAGALSITTGLSTALVGVMVAVALLPPASVLGLGLGRWNTELIRGAGLLLVTNVAGIVLAGVLTFRFAGIRPEKWWRQKWANRSVRRTAVVVVGLVILVGGTLVPPTLRSLDDARVSSQLLQVIDTWAPPYLEVKHLSLDLLAREPSIEIELDTSRAPEALDIAVLYNLIEEVVPGAVLRVELTRVREFELRRSEAGGVPMWLPEER
jgi:uncharacterized hydrophobic protein (TIGR00341 family)